MSENMSENKENQILYAFWKYDMPPYILGGRVKIMYDDGRVDIEEYGAGYLFTPIKILNEKSGEDFLNKLNQLKNEYYSSRKLFEKDFEIKFDNLLFENGIKK